MLLQRRQLFAALASVWPGLSLRAQTAAGPLRTRAIPSSGEAIPLVGLGSWITFNVGHDRRWRATPAPRSCAPSSPAAGD
jgi:hypothetical protein